MLREQAAPAAGSPAATPARWTRNLELGRKHQITGTPTLVFADGSRVPGAINAAAGREAALAGAVSPRAQAGPAWRLHYRVEAADLHAHLFHVTLTIEQPAAGQRVSLPVWIPGSYLVREFSKNLQRLVARQDGRPVAGAAARQVHLAARLRARQPARAGLRGLRLRPLGAHRLAGRRSAASSTAPACACGCTDRRRSRTRWNWCRRGPAGRRPPACRRCAWASAASAPTWRRTTTSWSTARWRWAASGAPSSAPAACRTGWWWPAPPSPSTARGWPPTCSGSARRRSASGTSGASRRCATTCSCSMRWTTATAAWSTATRRR